ncbi:MAG TPA: hypothetical protein VLJ68_07210 [Chitinophagaceae bacterium]|nr:hypothetical protein [Chitinophagaceae bacterium]
MLPSSPSGNRITVHFLPVICLLLFYSYKIPVHKHFQNGGSGRWTGTVTYKESMTSLLGPSERTITASFANAIPFCYIDELGGQASDDKGVGSHTYHAESIIEGKKFAITDCSGNGQAQLLAITFNEDEGMYSIGVNSNECNGKIVSLVDATVQDYGPDSKGVDIFKQTLGPDHNVLDGTKIEKRDMGVGTLVMTTTWHFVRVQDDVELIITPVDYDKWLPKPGIDEMSAGSEISINLKLQGKHGKPLNQKARSFELRLSATSREPGITINYPLKPMNPPLPDLRFVTQPNSNMAEEFQFMTVNCTGCTTANVKVDAFDGGGYSTLTAVAVLADGRRVTGNLLVSGGSAETSLPKRNGSMIAQSWLDANGKPGDYDDNETSKDNKNNGDGLTAYEEYRGVMSEGVYKRLDPRKKELGVTMQKTLFNEFSEGLNWFETASDIKIVRFNYLVEIGMDRRFNRNYSQGHSYDQDALRLNKVGLPNNVAGKAFTTLSATPDIPSNTTIIVISTDNIKQNYQNWTGWAQSNGLQLRWTEREYLAQTIAHEMGHGVKVWHHGDDANVPQGETAPQGGNPVYHIFDRNGIEIKDRPYTIPGNDRVCPCNTSQAGGDLSCVMAYIDVCDWVRISYADGSIGLFQSPLLAIGKNFCSGKDGTGVNAGTHTVSGVAYNNYFGKAANGACIGQITLK